MMIDAMAGSKTIQVFNETWGHLRPEKGTDHPGTMIIALSSYNDQGVVVVEKKFPTLANSPWFYEAMNDYVLKIMYERKKRSPGIYTFTGCVRSYKNGKLKFFGKITKMSLYPGRLPAVKSRKRMLSLTAAYQGKRKYDEHYFDSDRDYAEDNMDSVIRFLDTVNDMKTKEKKPC